jgi:hypothetical protein
MSCQGAELDEERPGYVQGALDAVRVDWILDWIPGLK